MHGGSVSELVGASVLVVGALDVIGLLSELGLLVPVVPRLFELELPSPVGLVDMPGPRGRIGPGRARGLPAPIGLPRPDGLRNDVVPDDTPEFVGLVNNGVVPGLSELPDDVDEGGETDETEPAGAVGEQLTPGVIIGDAL